MNVAWLEVFREVAARGSLVAASDALGYTQPAVSRQISALEKATGARLFDRVPRGMRLTAEGQCLLAHAEAVLDRLRAAHDDLEALRDLTAGTLRVGAFDTANAILVPRAMAAFRAAHPAIRLLAAEGTSATQSARLRDREIDLAVISIYPHQTLDASQLELHHLLDDPLMVAMPADHPLARAAPLRLADLAEESWIEGFPESSQTLTDVCLRAGFRPRVDFAMREWTGKLGFVAAGLGLALVPLLAVGTRRPGIVLTPLHPDDAPVRTIHAATWRGSAVTGPALAFMEYLSVTARSLLGTT